MSTVPKNARIFVAGHRGLVGSAIVRRLEGAGYTNLQVATREQLDHFSPVDAALDGHRAASTLVTVPALARPEWKMEISVIAARS